MLKVKSDPSDICVEVDFKSEPEMIIEELQNNVEHSGAATNSNQNNNNIIVINSDTDSDDDCYILINNPPLVVIEDDDDYEEYEEYIVQYNDSDSKISGEKEQFTISKSKVANQLYSFNNNKKSIGTF